MAIIMAIPSCATARVLAYGCFRHCVASLPRVSAHAATLDCATLSLSFSLVVLRFVFVRCVWSSGRRTLTAPTRRAW